jgi:hypothetical protein
MDMRTIPVQASRSVKIKDLAPEFKNLPAVKAAKGEEFTFAAPEDATADVPADLDEAVKVEGNGNLDKGKAAVYETYLRQKKTDIQNGMAVAILEKVLDPSKNKRSGAAIRISL